LKNSKQHEPIAMALADQVFKPGKAFSYSDIAKMIEHERAQRGVMKKTTVEEVSRHVSAMRIRLETNRACTLINIRGYGWRCVGAYGQSIAVFAMQNVKKTIMQAERTNRLKPLVDQKHIPEAITKVFTKASNQLVNISKIKKDFVLNYEKLRKGGALHEETKAIRAH